MVILSIDPGLVRTGIAVSDPMGMLASPVGTVTEQNEKLLLEKILNIATEKKAERIIMGHPRNMDGTRGDSAKRAEALARALEQASGIPVILRDERLTTVSAINVMNETNTRGKKRKAVIDTVSATILLQEYLDSLRSIS